MSQRQRREAGWFDHAQQNIAYAGEAHRKIQDFVNWAGKNLPGAIRERARVGGVDLGSFQVGDRQLQVLYGVMNYQARVEGVPEQPRVLSWRTGPALRLVDPEQHARKTIVYEGDVRELPRPIVGHLLRHLDGLKTGHVVPVGRLAR